MALKPQLATLKRTVIQKQQGMVDRMTKLVNEAEEFAKQEGITLPVDASSAAPTPVLTREPNTPQSSSPPSTNASAVGEALDGSDAAKTATPGDTYATKTATTPYPECVEEA